MAVFEAGVGQASGQRQPEAAGESADFDWAFGLNRLVLRAMGIWPSGRWRRTGNALRMPAMMLLMSLGLLLPEMWALSRVSSHFQLVVDNLLTSSPTLTSTLKLLFMWRRAHELQPVVESSRRDWAASRGRSPWEKETMRRHAGRARLVTALDYLIIMCCLVFFVYAPLLGLDIRLVNNITDWPADGRHLMVQSVYPFDPRPTPTFEAVVLVQQLCCLFIAMAVSTPDNYFVALVMHASAQYEILGGQLEGLQNDGPAELQRRLAGFVERHMHLARMVSLIERSFSLVTAVQVLCMILMVCCLGFETLGMLDPSAPGEKPTALQVLTLTAMIFYIMLHTLVNCLASETLAVRSEAIHSSIYDCQWYALPRQQMRYLIPMMLMSKNPQQIKAGKILIMSMETYCSIVKSTLGYLSVLIAVSAD